MMTILLVEDDTVLANMYSQKLMTLDCKVVLAKDGIEGLKAIKENKIDLIITDIMLPRLSGSEFIYKIKKDKKNSKIPIIAWSNLASNDEKNFVLNLGVNEYLIKANTSIAEIADKVNKYLK